MKFSCDQCHAQYMIADEKLGERGAKVRCKKCEHIIIVRPAAQQEEHSAADPAHAESGFQEPATDPGEAATSLGGAAVVPPEDSALGAGTDVDHAAQGKQAAADRAAAAQRGAAETDFSAASAGDATAAESNASTAKTGGLDGFGDAFDATFAAAASETAGADSAAESSAFAPGGLGDQVTAADATPGPAAMSNEGSDAGIGTAFDSLFGGGAAAGPAALPESPAPAASTTSAGEREWYVAIDDSQVGPIDLLEVEQRWDARDLTEDSLAWKSGMADWVPVAEIPGLAYLISERPHLNADAGLGSSFTNESTADGSATHTPAENLVPMSFGGTDAQTADVAWKPSAASALSSLVQEELVQQPGEAPDPVNPVSPASPATPEGLPDMGGLPGIAAPPPAADPFANAGSGFPAGFSMPTAPLPNQGGGLRAIHLVAAVLFLGVVGGGAFIALQFMNGQRLLGVQGPAVTVAVRGTETPPLATGVIAGTTTPVAKPAGTGANSPAPASPGVVAPSPPSETVKKPKKRKNKPRVKKDAGMGQIFSEPKKKKPDLESLGKKDIVDGFRRSAKNLKPCLKVARNKGEILPGKHKLVLNWTIKANGSVSGGRLTAPANLMGTSLTSCFAKAMKRWRFPSSRKDVPVRNFPFGPFTVR